MQLEGISSSRLGISCFILGLRPLQSILLKKAWKYSWALLPSRPSKDFYTLLRRAKSYTVQPSADSSAITTQLVWVERSAWITKRWSAGASGFTQSNCPGILVKVYGTAVIRCRHLRRCTDAEGPESWTSAPRRRVYDRPGFCGVCCGAQTGVHGRLPNRWSSVVC